MSPTCMDDLYFTCTHQADFETHLVFQGDAHIGDSVLWEAWVFRHLESFKAFFTQRQTVSCKQ